MNPLLEVCVDDAEGLSAALANGADRIELCQALSLGGLTPSAGLMAVAAKAQQRWARPIYAMIRPRDGDFRFSPDEVAVMEADIDQARHAGLAGVVLGANLSDGRLDCETLARLVTRAKGIGLTLHRSFDLVPDQEDALEAAISLGFARILTSGGAAKAPEAAKHIAALQLRAAKRITLMPGSGLTVQTLSAFDGLPLYEFHASCRSPVVQSGPAVALGFAQAQMYRTDPFKVAALRRAITDRQYRPNS